MTSVWVAEVGADHVILVWRSPDGVVELYEVSYWTDDSNISTVQTFYTNITLRGLRQQSIFMFRVRETTTLTFSLTLRGAFRGGGALLCLPPLWR